MGSAMWALIRLGFLTRGGQECNEVDGRRIEVLTATLDEGFQALLECNQSEVPDVDNHELLTMTALRLVLDARVPESALSPTGNVLLGVRKGGTGQKGQKKRKANTAPPEPEHG